jgi:general nucleoside transport system permease protein
MSELLILTTIAMAVTPLAFAALGELVTERAGVLNLGVEGMMLMGAVCGFIAVASGAHWIVGAMVGALAGAALASLFALLVLGLAANQVASGLALTIFGTGLSALIGSEYVGTPVDKIPAIVMGLDPMVFLVLALGLGITLWLRRTRRGLVLRAVGENAEAAHAHGHPVLRVRLAAILFGGAMSGLGGAYLSLAYTPLWAEGMTAGRGWIALALVVFGAWRPGRLLIGAYLFGSVGVLQLHAQSSGALAIPSEVLSMLPYLATIAVLALLSTPSLQRSAPAALGRPFRASH